MPVSFQTPRRPLPRHSGQSSAASRTAAAATSRTRHRGAETWSRQEAPNEIGCRDIATRVQMFLFNGTRAGSISRLEVRGSRFTGGLLRAVLLRPVNEHSGHGPAEVDSCNVVHRVVNPGPDPRVACFPADGANEFG